MTADVDFQHPFQPFDFVLKVFGEGLKGPFGHRSRQNSRQDREKGGIDFGDRDVMGVVGQLATGAISGFAHLGQRHLAIQTRVEFQLDVCNPLSGITGQTVEPR